MAKRGRKSIHELMEKNEFTFSYGTINGKYSKYKRGEVITDIKVLLEQKVIIWNDITKNVEMLKSLPLRVVLDCLEHRCFYYAIPKEKNKKSMDLEKAKMIESRLNDPQKVVVAVTTPRMSFYDIWKSVKPPLKPEPIIIIVDDIHYKKLKPRRSKTWNTRN